MIGKVWPTYGGNANITWSSFRSFGGRFCTASCASKSDGFCGALCDQRGVELLEGKAMADHVHLCLSIPPKYSVAHTVGFLKGKSAVQIHRKLLRERRMTGLHFWSTGYCVSTVGLDEGRIREYIREQEQLEAGQGDLDLK